MSNELVDLNKQKIDLQNKMEEIEAIKKTGIDQEAANMQAMPGEEDITIQQIADIQTKTCNLVIKLNRAGWVLRSVILFSDTVFTGGSFVVHPSQSTSTLKVPISYNKNQEEKIDIRILLGVGMNASHFLVH